MEHDRSSLRLKDCEERAQSIFDLQAEEAKEDFEESQQEGVST